MLKKYKNTYFKLFLKREGMVVLGRKLSNLWLLIAVLSATFLAVAFSTASLDYLSMKMEDPFIKWVDIENDFGNSDFFGFKNALSEPSNQSKYLYDGFQSDNYFSYMFVGADEKLQYYKCRFFQDITTPLIEAILDEDNIVDNCTIGDINDVSDRSIGFILSKEALTKLGYNKAPAYIDVSRYSPGADSLGFTMLQGEFTRLPVPVLAVVKRLPSNMDVISTQYFYSQDNNDNTHPFNLSNSGYARSLHYFYPEEVDVEEISSRLKELTDSISTRQAIIDEYGFYKPEIIPYIPGSFISVVSYEDDLIPLEVQQINALFLKEYAKYGVHRVYDYDFSNYEMTESSYASVYFHSLDSIRAFEDYAKREFQVKIDMNQINTKENFNAVSLMANILSWAIVGFAIICIVLFVVNLLKSYFQKVKKNLGTFKAFGMSNSELINIYMLIMAAMIIFACISSLGITYIVQISLILIGVLKDGEFSFLSVWSWKTMFAAIVIFIATLSTVYEIMRRLLKSTPGDLIYDR